MDADYPEYLDQYASSIRESNSDYLDFSALTILYLWWFGADYPEDD